MSTRALPPGPPLSTRAVQALVAARVRIYGRQVLSALRPLFRDLDGPGKVPVSTAERFAAGGALVLPSASGSVMHPDELRDYLARAEYPLLRATEGGFSITSGADVLSRAVGAGARSVEVMVRDRGAVDRLSLRLTPGITQAQISAAMLALPEVPKFELGPAFRRLSEQAIRSANYQLRHLDVGAPFKNTPESERRFQLAARRAERTAEFRARQLRSEIVSPLRERATSAPRLIRDTDIGHESKAFEQVVDRPGVRAEMAGRGVDQEAHEADVETAQTRSEKLGIRRYKWISSRDERTRKRHLDMDGQVYSWDNPPEADPGQYYHPGKRNKCRCTPSALEEDILAALGGE